MNDSRTLLQYDVQVVPDGDLPAGIDRVLVERQGCAPPLLLVKHSAAGTVRLVAASQRAHNERVRPLRIVV